MSTTVPNVKLMVHRFLLLRRNFLIVTSRSSKAMKSWAAPSSMTTKTKSKTVIRTIWPSTTRWCRIRWPRWMPVKSCLISPSISQLWPLKNWKGKARAISTFPKLRGRRKRSLSSRTTSSLRNLKTLKSLRMTRNLAVSKISTFRTWHLPLECTNKERKHFKMRYVKWRPRSSV